MNTAPCHHFNSLIINFRFVNIRTFLRVSADRLISDNATFGL